MSRNTDHTTEALVLASQAGGVRLQGPGNISLILTPEAAERTAQFLLAAAKRARSEALKAIAL